MHAKTNKSFLATITPQAREQILSHIATHYGTSTAEIYTEVTEGEAEHLLDYMTGPARSAASVLMQKHNARVAQ